MYVVDPPPIASLSIAGLEQRFPIHRIFCIGRNYAAHTREMGADPRRDPPFFFMKPPCAAVDAAGGPVTVPYPPMTENYHHEVELVVAIGKAGFVVSVERALDHVYGYAVGLDMTRRDLQMEARARGWPWEMGKSFSMSAPLGPIHRVTDCGDISNSDITLHIDGVRKQSSSISQMIWSVAECIAHLSAYEALQPGDLIMTGTPEGVSPVRVGNTMIGQISRLGQIAVQVVDSGRSR